MKRRWIEVLESTKRIKYLISPASGSGIYRKTSNKKPTQLSPVPKLDNSATLEMNSKLVSKTLIGTRNIKSNQYTRDIEQCAYSGYKKMSEEEIRKQLIESFRENRKPLNKKKKSKKKKKKGK